MTVGAAAGLSQEVVDAVASGRMETLPEPYDYERLAAILTRTMAWRPVPEDLQASAAAQWGVEGLVEIVVLSGFCHMFAAINQGFDIQPAMG